MLHSNKPYGGIFSVAGGEGDHVTAGEGIQIAPSSRKATHGPRWNTWPGTEGTGSDLSVAYTLKWSEMASDQISSTP